MCHRGAFFRASADVGRPQRCESEDRRRRRQFVSLLGGTALAPAHRHCRYTRTARRRPGTPVARDDRWPIAAVNDDKLVDRDALCRMADSAELRAPMCTPSWFARGGKLAFERFFKGSDQDPMAVRWRASPSTPIQRITSSWLRRASRRSHSGSRSMRADTKRQRTDLQLLPRVVRFVFPRRTASSWCTRPPRRWG